MSTRAFYRKPPADNLPAGYNIVRFPSGTPTVRLHRNQRIRAAVVGIIRAYDVFLDVAKPVIDENRSTWPPCHRINDGTGFAGARWIGIAGATHTTPTPSTGRCSGPAGAPLCRRGSYARSAITR